MSDAKRFVQRGFLGWVTSNWLVVLCTAVVVVSLFGGWGAVGRLLRGHPNNPTSVVEACNYLHKTLYKWFVGSLEGAYRYIYECNSETLRLIEIHYFKEYGVELYDEVASTTYWVLWGTDWKAEALKRLNEVGP